MATTTTTLATVRGQDAVQNVSRGIVPQNMADMWQFAQAAAKSGLYAVQSPEAAFMILQTGMELGLRPTQALRGIYIVKGKPVLSADLCVAIVRSSPECEEWTTVESTAQRCVIRAKRRGQEAESKTWTIDDAKRASLLGNGTWTAYPSQMLRHRCAMDLARQVFPDLLLGLYAPAEFGDVRDMAPEAVRVEIVDAEHTSGEHPAEPGIVTDLRAQIAGEVDVPVERLAVLYLEAQDAGYVTAETVEAVQAYLLSVAPGGTSKHALNQAIGAARCESDYQRARSTGEIEAIDVNAAALKLAKSSPARARLVAARTAAVARLQPKPPTDGGDGPKGKPAANDAAEAHGDAYEGSDASGPVASAAPGTLAHWRDHIAGKSNVFECVASYAKHRAEYPHVADEHLRRVVLDRALAIDPSVSPNVVNNRMTEAVAKRRERRAA